MEDAVTVILLFIIKKGLLLQFDRKYIMKILQLEDEDIIKILYQE